MKRLNLLFTLTSINVVLVTIERYSPTTKILLEPDNFARLHELLQIVTLILFTVLIPYFTLQVLSNNFKLLQTKQGKILTVVFVIGVYFYATGNGLHEIASFLFNNYCNHKHFPSAICKSMFVDNYYFGNILYFIGAFLMVIPLALFERINPQKNFSRNDYIILGINSIIYGLTIFAYAGFDIVLVGLWYGIITTVVVDILLISTKHKSYYPYTIYTALAYTLGTLAALLVRLH